jgi:Uncharacterized alpha/beta hydrolase domain (DUF2235)
VEAYGMPIATLKRGLDLLLWPMRFRNSTLSSRVERACHALSLDDERTPFHPLLWDEAAEKRIVMCGVKARRITQVWFAGVHSNVGGGYPDDRLSLVPLLWIMREAKACDLPLDDAIRKYELESSQFARLYDSRAGLAAYYPYGPRQIPNYEIGVTSTQESGELLPIVDGSVIMRMAYGPDQYAPIILPRRFWVMARDGNLLPMPDSPEWRFAESEKTELHKAMELLFPPGAVELRSKGTKLVWDTIWWRRVLYNITVL